MVGTEGGARNGKRGMGWTPLWLSLCVSAAIAVSGSLGCGSDKTKRAGSDNPPDPAAVPELTVGAPDAASGSVACPGGTGCLIKDAHDGYSGPFRRNS